MCYTDSQAGGSITSNPSPGEICGVLIEVDHLKVTLTSEQIKTFRAFLSASLVRYGMDAADIADHVCRIEPSGKEREALKHFKMGSMRCPCKELKLGGVQRARRKKMREAVQNALNEKRPLSHARAYALYLLLINSTKAVAWRRAHPKERDQALELMHSPQHWPFSIPPDLADRTPPQQYPAVALTPHGVVALADALTEALREQKLIRRAKDDTRACIIATLREMHDECNDALVARLRLASGFRPIHVTEEEVPIESEIVRRQGFTSFTRRTTVVRDWKVPPPDGAREPDRWEYLQAMLWDQWCLFESLASDTTHT